MNEAMETLGWDFLFTVFSGQKVPGEWGRVKVLFIAGHEFLYNPQNGGQKCSLRNYELLKQVLGSENVYLCMFSNYSYTKLNNNERIFPTQKNNVQLFLNTLTRRNVCDHKTIKRVKKYVRNLDIDAIFADSSTIGYLIKTIKCNVPVISFFHNIEANYAWNKYKHEGKKYIIAYWSYFYNEKCMVQLANQIILLNKRDEKELERLYGRNADFFLPITFTDTFDEKKIRDESNKRYELLFVGSLFQPNVEGLKWFIDKVMQKLDKKTYFLKIIGKNLETKKIELERENVEVIGTVDNLEEYYLRADAVVIPIFYGDGMKVKTAEAMMYGKMIFATDEALEGYDINNVEGIYRCNNAGEFIDRLKSTRFKRFNDTVRSIFKNKYDTAIISKDFQGFLTRFIQEIN